MAGEEPPVLKAPRGGKADALTRIDGVGVAIARKLNAIGIHHFDQIANWSEANAVWVGERIGFPGRPQRENWVEQARTIAADPKGKTKQA